MDWLTRKTLHVILVVVVFGLCSCNGSLCGGTSYLDGYPAFAGHGLVNLVVEIPAGTNDKWSVEEASGSLKWELKDGRRRVIQYLPYPTNYGMIPRTSLPYEIGGDGDPLDALLLGLKVERGAVVHARPIGVLRLIDGGERDDKVLTVPIAGPLSDVVNLETLASRYPGTREIIETWFTNYKGPARLRSRGFGDAAEAIAVVREASRYYEVNARSSE